MVFLIANKNEKLASALLIKKSPLQEKRREPNLLFLWHVWSAAYGRKKPQLVHAPSIEEACKKLLLREKQVEDRRFEYFMFDTTDVKMSLDDDRVTFTFDPSHGETRSAFAEYFKTMGREHDMFLTYSEFPKIIDELKHFLVYETDVTDDPFPSFIWSLVPVDRISKYVNLIYSESKYEFTDTLHTEEGFEVDQWTMSDLQHLEL